MLDITGARFLKDLLRVVMPCLPVLHLGFGNEGRQPPPSLVSGGQLYQRQRQFTILNLIQIV